MALPIQILIGLLILAAFVIAFFSARTWHWGHVIVVLGIFLSTLVFLVLAVETLRIYAVLGKQVKQHERDLAEVRAQNEALEKGTKNAAIIGQLQSQDPPIVDKEGTEELLSLEGLQHRLLMATRMRGRMWRNVMPAGVDANTGAIRITAEQPVPAGFKGDTVVYVFEDGPAQLAAENGKPQGPQYIGEFRVSEAAAQQATLMPVGPMDEFERARLTASRGPWIVYDTMPVDRHQIFAGLSEEELRKRIPAKSVEEYIRHGGEAKPDDPEERQVGYDADGKRLLPEQLNEAAKRVYNRRLRDYASEFDELARRRIAMLVDKDAVAKDNARLAAALESAKKLQAYREQEIKRLKTDLAGVVKERKTIEAHYALVQQQLKRASELLAGVLKQNRELATKLAQGQNGSGAINAAPVAPVVQNAPLAAPR